MINWKYKKPYTETYEIELRQTNPTTSNSSPAHTDTYEDCITKKGRGKNKIQSNGHVQTPEKQMKERNDFTYATKAVQNVYSFY